MNLRLCMAALVASLWVFAAPARALAQDPTSAEALIPEPEARPIARTSPVATRTGDALSEGIFSGVRLGIEHGWLKYEDFAPARTWVASLEVRVGGYVAHGLALYGVVGLRHSLVDGEVGEFDDLETTLRVVSFGGGASLFFLEGLTLAIEAGAAWVHATRFRSEVNGAGELIIHSPESGRVGLAAGLAAGKEVLLGGAWTIGAEARYQLVALPGRSDRWTELMAAHMVGVSLSIAWSSARVPDSSGARP